MTKNNHPGINIGIIGAGYWGPNLIRNFIFTSECVVKTVADLDSKKLAVINKLYPQIKLTQNTADILKDSTIDAVVIATPITTHFLLAKKALLSGKHVLVEKPMAASTKQANILIEMSQKQKKVLMVDHTFLYTGAVKKIKQLHDTDEIGKIKYFDSTRINLGLFQTDKNVLWDLAPHDISIISYLVKEKPEFVQATGISHLQNGIENIAYLTILYPSGLIAHFSCSWASPVKIRKILIGGDKKMVVYDDIEPTEKIKVYDCGYQAIPTGEKHNILIDYRMGDIFVPKLDTKEALAKVADDFIQAIHTNTNPLSDALSGFEVVKVLELAQQSLLRNGKAMKYE